MPPDHPPRGVVGPYRAFDVVAIAASAGGLAAVTRVCAALPPDFPAAIVLVQHVSRTHPSLLVEVLQRHAPFPVCWAHEGDSLRAGRLVVAPPDYHLGLHADGTQALTQTPLVHFLRPAADVLFTAVARHFGTRAVGVVLSGTGRDGARGVTSIKDKGGRVLVQDAPSAAHFAMPAAAIATGCVDFVLPLAHIAPALVTLVMAPEAAALFCVGVAFSRAHLHRTHL